MDLGKHVINVTCWELMCYSTFQGSQLITRGLLIGLIGKITHGLPDKIAKGDIAGFGHFFEKEVFFGGHQDL